MPQPLWTPPMCSRKLVMRLRKGIGAHRDPRPCMHHLRSEDGREELLAVQNLLLADKPNNQKWLAQSFLCKLH